MLAKSVRSGVVETYHDGSVVALAPDGKTLLTVGDADRPFFLRSAIKPFQATVSLESGAALDREQTALAAGSHGGQPVHVAVVDSILSGAGLSRADLACPPTWPTSSSARDRHLRTHTDPKPRRVFHNCSGKHAAALAACVAQGWSTATYLDADHPYQRRVLELLGDVTGGAVTPVGIDGCGFPTAQSSVRGLAQAFIRLDDERFGRVTRAMMAAPQLTSDSKRADAAISVWLGGVAKVGAAACAGVLIPGRVAIGAKCWDGSVSALWVGVIEVLDRLGMLEPVAKEALHTHRRPAVEGGGRVVGRLEPALS